MTIPAVDETQSALMTCTAESKPQLTLTLFRLSQSATEITDGIVKKDNSLEYRMEQVSREHAGDYKCTADNGYGSAVPNTATLLVRCKLFLYTF